MQQSNPAQPWPPRTQASSVGSDARCEYPLWDETKLSLEPRGVALLRRDTERQVMLRTQLDSNSLHKVRTLVLERRRQGKHVFPVDEAVWQEATRRLKQVSLRGRRLT